MIVTSIHLISDLSLNQLHHKQVLARFLQVFLAELLSQSRGDIDCTNLDIRTTIEEKRTPSGCGCYFALPSEPAMLPEVQANAVSSLNVRCQQQL